MGFTDSMTPLASYFLNRTHKETSHYVPRKVQILAITLINTCLVHMTRNRDNSNATSEEHSKYIFKISVVFY